MTRKSDDWHAIWRCDTHGDTIAACRERHCEYRRNTSSRFCCCCFCCFICAVRLSVVCLVSLTWAILPDAAGFIVAWLTRLSLAWNFPEGDVKPLLQSSICVQLPPNLPEQWSRSILVQLVTLVPLRRKQCVYCLADRWSRSNWVQNLCVRYSVGRSRKLHENMLFNILLTASPSRRGIALSSGENYCR